MIILTWSWNQQRQTWINLIKKRINKFQKIEINKSVHVQSDDVGYNTEMVFNEKEKWHKDHESQHAACAVSSQCSVSCRRMQAIHAEVTVTTFRWCGRGPRRRRRCPFGGLIRIENRWNVICKKTHTATQKAEIPTEIFPPTTKLKFRCTTFLSQIR